jgi:hypothetical protein
MQITTYRTITNQSRTSSLKKLSYRARIELTKKSNRTNRTRTKIESNIERIMNYELFLQPYFQLYNLSPYFTLMFLIKFSFHWSSFFRF